MDRVGQNGVTLRAVLIGLGVVATIDVWVTYAEMYVRASRMTIAHFPLALFACLLLLLGASRVLRGMGLRPLSAPEHLVILSMGLVGSVMPVEGVVGFLLGIISSFYYFASPENQWAEYFHPHLPQWLVPEGSPAIWAQFFEAVGVERGIPWEMWVIPLFWWATFVGATLWVSACAMVVLRKQWVEHERLVYPLAAVAVQMLGGSGSDAGRRLVRRGLFWAGVLIPFLLFCWQIVGWHRPGLPLTGVYPEISPRFQFTRHSINMVVNPFQFFTMGFAYFANVEVLFSVWFFFLVHVAEGSVLSRLGYGLKEAGSDLFCGNPPAVGWQGFGAMITMVVWGLWVARRHLGSVLRKAFHSDKTVDDSGEMLSYRVAVWGGVLGLLYLFLWLCASGMEASAAILFLIASFVIYIGSARIVAESGLLYTWAAVSPQAFAVNILGSNAMTGAGMTSILLSYGLINYLRGLFAPALAHVARFGSMIEGRRKQLLWAVALGACVGLVVSFWYTLDLCYTHGAYNTYGWPRFFNGNPKAIFSNTLSKVRNPFPTDWPRILFAAAGGVTMAALTLLRSRLTWWRIHPVGFATSAMINTHALAMPIFLAWCTKSIILRVGGVQLYRRSMPLFVGLIVGYVAGVCVCFCVDAVWFPQKGHLVHGW